MKQTATVATPLRLALYFCLGVGVVVSSSMSAQQEASPLVDQTSENDLPRNAEGIALTGDPRQDENLELSGGRGMLLMRHYLSSVRYNERGNGVTLCKYRSRS